MTEKTKDMKVVRLLYLDPASYSTGEYPADYNFTPIKYDTVGFLMKEDENNVILAREINSNMGNKFRYIQVIPKMLIVERKDLSQ